MILKAAKITNTRKHEKEFCFVGFVISSVSWIWMVVAALFFVSPRINALDEPQPQLRVGFSKPGGGYRLETLPLETYVARVLAGEAARDSQPAALEALAITIRTFALANRGRHRADGFDLCDQTHCQVLRAATAATEKAAAATAGRLLVRAGAPASVYYTASCGGRTAAGGQAVRLAAAGTVRSGPG